MTQPFAVRDGRVLARNLLTLAKRNHCGSRRLPRTGMTHIIFNERWARAWPVFHGVNRRLTMTTTLASAKHLVRMV